MVFRSFLRSFLVMSILVFPLLLSAVEVPNPSLNIANLCTFSQESSIEWGDDDFSQTIFFSVPETFSKTIFIRLYDPDVGGKIDEIQGHWDSETRFELFGGTGTYTNPDARRINPEGNYRSGTSIAGKTYGKDPSTDDAWVAYAEVEPSQGELHKGNYYFKLIVDGVKGNDGNLYKIDFSTSPDGFTDMDEIEIFSYEWSFRLPNVPDAMIHTFPFKLDRGTEYVINSLWDFDFDNKIYLNTPTRPGLPVYSTGNREWAMTKMKFGVQEKDLAAGKAKKDDKKRWFSTTYDILDEDYDAPWSFQINKGKFKNNDIVLSVVDQDQTALRLYSAFRPRTCKKTIIGGKVYEPRMITTNDLFFIERDTVINGTVTLASGSLLPSGTRLLKETRIPQTIYAKGGGAIAGGSVLRRNIELGRQVILKEKIELAEGTRLKKGTQIAPGSVVCEDLAPGPDVMPSCNTVHLDSSHSTDPDGNPLTFRWFLGDGSQAQGERVVHTYRKSGSYVVNLIATDDSGAVNDAASKTITITINSPPVADAGENKTVCTGEVVRFDGSKSNDLDGYISNYKWFFGDGTSSDGVTTTHEYEKPGVYSVRLDIMDNSDSLCSVDSDSIVVVVNDPPVAKAGKDVYGCESTIAFDGSKSHDSDGKISRHIWYFGDGNVGEGPVVKHTYEHPGRYKVKLVVYDDSESKCNMSSDEMEVAINAAPIAQAGEDRTICEGEEVFFNGKSSSDPNGDVFTYKWDFGDNTPVSTEASPSHVYAKRGKYTVSLTLKDKSGTACDVGEDQATITVDENPKADAGKDRLVDVGQKVVFDASASNDPNDYPLDFTWTFGDLSEPATGKTVEHAYDKPGVYGVLLAIKNTANHGCNSADDEVKVTVNHPPVAKAGSPIMTHAGADVKFDGKESYDPDGKIVSYDWDFADKTEPYGSGKSVATHKFEEPGRYNVTLTVKDDSGLPGGVDKDTVLVIVNHPPIANPGPPRDLCVGQVLFDGTESKDPDGSIISYEWDFGDGNTGSGGRPVHIYRSPGIYDVRLTVTDNSGTGSSQSTAMTKVEINGPPVVDIGEKNLPTCPGVETELDASDTSDPNNDPISYVWDFGDGEKAEGPTVKHVYKKPGRYVASVTAKDGKEMLCSATTASKVVIVNEAPMADAGQDQLVNPNDKVLFDGAGSADPDGKITGHEWNFDDGQKGAGKKAAHSYAVPGKYVVKLTVKDDSGLSACDSGTDEMTVTVNSPPIADAGIDRMGECSRTVTFDGAASKDPDGKISFYEWDFGDGSPRGVGEKPSHTYAKPGTYNVILKVTDDSGLVSGKSTDTMKIVINDPPVALIEAPDVVCPDDNVKFSAKDAFDSDGQIVGYEWKMGDGSRPVTGRNPVHSYDKPGKYTVLLTVTDNSDSKCNTATAKHVISVNTPPDAVAGEDMITCVQTTDCSVTVDAGQSGDADGDHMTYSWDFGDGNIKDGIRAQHEYLNPGKYTVTLTVMDDSGTNCNKSTDTLKVTANAPPDADIRTIK